MCLALTKRSCRSVSFGVIQPSAHHAHRLAAFVTDEVAAIENISVASVFLPKPKFSDEPVNFAGKNLINLR